MRKMIGRLWLMLFALYPALCLGFEPSSKGVWLTDFAEATNSAFTTGTPLVMVASKAGCDHCAAFKTDLSSPSFTKWMSEGRYLFCRIDKNVNGSYSYVASAGGNCTPIRAFPYVALIWPRGNGILATNFVGRSGEMLTKNVSLTLSRQLSESADLFFADYTEGPSARFVASGAMSDRLEAEVGRPLSVCVPIRRTNVAEAEAYELKAVLPHSDAPFVIPVAFSGGSAVPQSIPIVSADSVEGAAAGDIIRLELTCGGKTVATSSVTFVERAVSSSNPLWLGERDAMSLRPAEWTMDRDLALSCARAGNSFVLNLVAGSLWCPDCVKTDRNFIETSAFAGWLESNGVYCAQIDIPRLSSGGRTCLMTYDAVRASDGYVNALTAGTDIDPDEMRMQSGAGYLSRKGISAGDAEAVLARNIALATNRVASGGLCVPEKARLGVPTFVVQNADGRVIGRFDRFAAVSPTNSASAAAYVRRLDEILRLKDDPTEELNGHWSTATTTDCALGVRGGAVASTISAIDLSDYWRITGRDCWTRASFTVRGRSGETLETNVRLNLWKVESGRAEKIATESGNLAAGVRLSAQEIQSDAAIDYFIQVESIATSAAFALDRDGDSMVVYDLTAESADDTGDVTFARTSAMATEADAKKAGGTLRILVPVVRTGGASGATNVTVQVSESSTAMSDRYRIVTDAVRWNDGEQGVKNIEIDVFDDGNADGTQSLVLSLGASTFALDIVDNDRANAGKVSFSEAEPTVVKKGVVVAQEGTHVRIGVARRNGASGDAVCSVKSSAGVFAGPTNFTWVSRASGVQWTELALPLRAECPSGKVTVSFAALDGIAADSSARTLTIQLVDADAPRFAETSRSFDLVRHCAVSQTIAVLNLVADARAKVAKLSGSLPSGVKVKLVGGNLLVSGVPTARGGVYETVYQVSQTVGRKTQAGQTIRLSFAVTDVAAADPSAPGANPSVAKRRTIPDMMVIDASSGRLVGIVSGLAIAPTGKCSAKYRCSEGTISLSSRSWSGYDAATGALSAGLTASRKPHSLTVTALRDGAIDVSLIDPACDGVLTVAASGEWSSANPATPWVGSYTAAFADAEGESMAVGAPVLTLQMTASNARTGTMRYAGVLPNGQTFSGSSVLVADGVDAVLLPIYYRTGKDFLTAVLRIKADGAVQAVGSTDGISPWWTHTEALPEANSEVRYGMAVGSWIDADINLRETVDPEANGHDLVAVGAVEGLPVVISEKTVKLDAAAAKTVGAKLTISRKTGLVSGSFKVVNAAGKTVTATYRGVMLPDWGDGCPTCGGIPWAMGAYWFGERLTGEVNGRPKTLNVKVGDILYIEAK